jgi:hypothetical protein
LASFRLVAEQRRNWRIWNDGVVDGDEVLSQHAARYLRDSRADAPRGCTEVPSAATRDALKKLGQWLGS